MPYCLVPADSGKPIVIDKPILFVGRDPECDIVLTDSRKVSRKHCCIALVNEQLKVRDLGSMNGIWINGNRVHRDGDVCVGDELAIGDVRYELETVGSKQSAIKTLDEDSGGGMRTMEDDDFDPLPDPSPRIRPSKDVDLSQDIPIAIPDEDEEFIVEASHRNIQDANRPILDDDSSDDDGRRSGENDEILMLRDD